MEHKVDFPNKPLNSEIFYNENGFGLVINNGELFVIGAKSQKEADDALKAHNPPAPTEPTIAEKLASVGLSVDDLKAALGL